MPLSLAPLLLILFLSTTHAVQASDADEANDKFKGALENLTSLCDKNHDGKVFHESPHQKQKTPANDSELQEQRCYTQWFTQSQFAIAHCDVNSDGKVTTKKTWKTDGVSKEIAKKENSCRLALENKLLDQSIAQGGAEVAKGHEELVSMLEPLSEKDLTREISKLDKRIRMTKDKKQRDGLIYLRNIMIELSKQKRKAQH